METGEPEAVAAFLQTRLDTLGREDKAQVGRVVRLVRYSCRRNKACLQEAVNAEVGCWAGW